MSLLSGVPVPNARAFDAVSKALDNIEGQVPLRPESLSGSLSVGSVLSDDEHKHELVNLNLPPGISYAIILPFSRFAKCSGRFRHPRAVCTPDSSACKQAPAVAACSGFVIYIPFFLYFGQLAVVSHSFFISV